VRPLSRAWIGATRLRRSLAARTDGVADKESLVRRHVPGRSFLDVGCMWSVHGRYCFAAEDAGATTVTGVDVMPPTAEFEAARARRGSGMRFVAGDLHDPAVLEEVGVHDIVFCGGVLYHAPHPVLTLERLRSICRERLVLATATIPEVPGVEQACVFYPGLSDGGRAAYVPVLPGHRRLAITEPFDVAEGYGNWWWGITPSALRGMLGAAGFVVEEMITEPFHVTAVAAPAS